MAVLLLGFGPGELDGAYIEQVRALAPDMRVVVTRERAEIAALVEEIEIAAGFGFPYDLLPQARRLRWIQQWGAGADWLMRHPEAAALDFTLTNTSGVHAIPISEQILGYMLMFARGLHRAARAQARRAYWRPEQREVSELAGKTLLLVGVGAIGERAAALARALGMRVEGIRRDAASPADGVDAIYGPDALHERLPEADYVVLTVPLTPATRNLIGAAELALMKPTAYLVNIGRGGTVDEAALAEALRAGRIAGAALDVFETEPLPPESPLWELENVILTMHYAGMNPSYNERAMAIFLDNLRRYRAGEPLRNVVDKRAGY